MGPNILIDLELVFPDHLSTGPHNSLSTPNGLFEMKTGTQTEDLMIEDNNPLLEGICVDASTIENPGVTEYRGVDTKTGQIIFQQKYEEATNNNW
ncbi:hypothetical protein [Flavihumibacter fluvii]|uniref:hypothetical protein n=1 Tax=Flavihumibacter fluvii TaxID=2838157 RepID=UPI001BDF574D|nr:hypothetical protein [Flavihumibacter fluvii]ULQ52147.1 hypothetical protein KJS93_18815 [Flavihumibacter fluvii]